MLSPFPIEPSKSFLSSMVPQLIETNEKQVDKIYLSTVGKEIDTFTVVQADELFYIANQCPMVGGNSVYKARSLYRLIDDEQQFDDPELCLLHGIIVKSMVAQEMNTVGVVPNPTRDQATLVLEKPLDASGVCIIFNAIGVEVLRYSIPMDMARFEFSTSSLPSGLYHYRVRGPSGTVGAGKLTISR